MTGNGLYQQIKDIITPLVDDAELTLWGFELGSGPKMVVRIYVEGPEGVTIAQCAKLSRHIGLTLEVEDVLSDAYTLEVSSPGLERPFFTAEQVSHYIGKPVLVVLRDPHEDVPGRRKFQGEVKSVTDNIIVLTLPNDEGDLTIDWEDLKKAHLVHIFPDTSKGKKKK
jgi:ribosome maturation factor RimP